LSGLPATDGRQLFVGDGAGNAYLVQLAERRVFEIDETGHARLKSELEAETSLSGALRAAVGDRGETWVFGFAPHSVRVFENGEEVEADSPGAVVTGMAVTGGRPTVALAPVTPDVGADVGRAGGRPKTPPLVVQLDAKGIWRPWIDRDPTDLAGTDFFTLGMLGFETRLAGDTQGRLLMARRYRYDVREYKKSGTLTDRLTRGEKRSETTPSELAKRLERSGGRIHRPEAAPESVIESVAWSPDGDVMVLATAKDGYVLDRWVPALQLHQRLPLAALKGRTRLQMVAGRSGLMFLPGTEAPKLTVVPWDYLRDAKWQDLDHDLPAPPAP
jgi:hypothetical protein